MARRTHGSLARPVELSWWTLILSFPATIVILLVSHHPYWKNLDFLIPGLAAAVLNIYSGVLGFSAYKHGEASLISPLTNLLPVALIVSSFLMFGSLPGRWAALAIILVVGGVYYSSVNSNKNSLLRPFTILWHQRGSRAMLGCVLIWSVSINLEKIALRTTTPAFLLLYSDLISLSLLGMYLAVQRKTQRSERVLGRWWKHITVIAVFSTLAIFFQMKAVSITANTSYVLAIKRLDVLLVIVVAALFLGEHHLVRRLRGAATAIIGVVLLYFGT